MTKQIFDKILLKLVVNFDENVFPALSVQTTGCPQGGRRRKRITRRRRRMEEEDHNQVGSHTLRTRKQGADTNVVSSGLE
jgi:hypothetical protein